MASKAKPKVKIPEPAKKVRDAAIKYGVEQSCKTAVAMTLKSGAGSVSDADQKIVVDQLCLVVSMTTDALLKGESTKASDIGIYLTRQGVNLTRLSHRQQMLCVAALADFTIHGFKLTTEFMEAGRNTRTAAMIGSIAGPEGTLLFGGVTAASHLPSIVHLSSKVVSAAIDAHSQCGPLVLDKVQKPRTPFYGDDMCLAEEEPLMTPAALR